MEKKENEKEVSSIIDVVPVRDKKIEKVHSYGRKYKDKIKKDNQNKKPQKYDTNIATHLNDILQWIQDDMTIAEICKKLDVCPDFFYRMKNEHVELQQIFDIGNRLLCSKVESSLVNLCTGFHYKTAKTTTWFDDDGNKHQKVEEIDNYLPPNNASIQFLLKNRAPDRWKNDTQELLITNKNESDRKQLFMDMLKEDAKDADVVDTEPKQIDNGND